MLKPLISAAAILTVAGAASAFEFSISAVNGGNVDGLGLSGNFYQSPLGGNIPPLQGLVSVLGADLEADTYVGLDAVGPTTADYQSDTAVSFAGPTVMNETTVSCVWFDTVFTQSGPDERIFLGRFTTTDGVAPTGALRVAGLEGFHTSSGNLNFDGTPMTVSNDGTFFYAQAYFIDLVATEYELSSGAIVTAFDAYLAVVPTPGAAALFGVAGLAAVRRRR